MNSIDTILKYIHGSDDFVVTSHVNPDGDNVGSTLSIYYFLKNLNKKVYYVRNEEINKVETIDKDIATALYTGLITDTGKLTYSNTHASSFDMAKNLLLIGADTQKVVQNVFGSNPFNFYKLLGEALNTLEIFNTKVAIMMVTQEMLQKYNIDFKDIDGIVPYARDIENVEIGILLKEKGNNEIKVSLRSKAYADVSKIAKVFAGGGHMRASGCTINDNIENAKSKILEEALKEI